MRFLGTSDPAQSGRQQDQEHAGGEQRRRRAERVGEQCEDEPRDGDEQPERTEEQQVDALSRQRRSDEQAGGQHADGDIGDRIGIEMRLGQGQAQEIEGEIRGTMKPKAAPPADDNPNIVRGTESVQRRGKMVREYTEEFILYRPQTVRTTLRESRKPKQKFSIYKSQ